MPVRRGARGGQRRRRSHRHGGLATAGTLRADRCDRRPTARRLAQAHEPPDRPGRRAARHAGALANHFRRLLRARECRPLEASEVQQRLGLHPYAAEEAGRAGPPLRSAALARMPGRGPQDRRGPQGGHAAARAAGHRATGACGLRLTGEASPAGAGRGEAAPCSSAASAAARRCARPCSGAWSPWSGPCAGAARPRGRSALRPPSSRRQPAALYAPRSVPSTGSGGGGRSASATGGGASWRKRVGP